MVSGIFAECNPLPGIERAAMVASIAKRRQWKNRGAMRTAEEMVRQFNMSSMADLEDLVEMAMREQRQAIADELDVRGATYYHTIKQNVFEVRNASDVVRDLTRPSDALEKQQKHNTSFPAIPIDPKDDALVDGMLAKARGKPEHLCGSLRVHASDEEAAQCPGRCDKPLATRLRCPSRAFMNGKCLDCGEVHD